jgi:DNA helicase-2/ATP-dependent DNA helicase PcrA
VHAGLNPEQRRAVEHRGGPVLVLAGAGTGKTRVITHRVAALMDEGVEPWRILAVTFTNKAAGEMRERIARLREDASQGLWVGTFHSICARILRKHGDAVGLSRNFGIYDAADQRTLMGRVLKDQRVSDKILSANGVLSQIDRAKNQGRGHEALEELGVYEPQLTIVREAWREYERRLRAADAADFGDLLVLTVRLLRQASAGPQGQLGELDPVARLRRRFTHVVVDEFQDTNPVQAELVDLLSGHAQLCVVGDDDQAIYGWRGADVAQILSFPDRHAGCEVIRLEQNYRSTTHILGCADAIIKRNRGRLGKTLWSDLGPGNKVRLVAHQDERTEARRVAGEIAGLIAEGEAPDEIAVFYRTHAQSRALEEALRREGVHYRIVGGTRFFDRAEIKDLIAYLRLLVNPASDLDLLRVINRPGRGIGNKTVERLATWAHEHGTSLWESLSHAEEAGLGTAARRKVLAFEQLMQHVANETADLRLDEIAELVLEHTGYREALAANDDIESVGRLENLQEFLGALAEFALEEPESSLAEYLELVSLATNEDEAAATGITLMTVHSAKGLEFDHVYLTGMEERVFPHARSLDDPVAMEEERRLAYVAVTRARRNLTLSYTARRFLYGSTQVNLPSRFVGDLPLESLREIGVARHRPRAARNDFADFEPDEPDWDDDIELDAEFAAESEGVSLYVGMPIRHAKFGVGDLVGWNGAGDNLKVVVRFPNHGQKTILARFCQPV